MSRPEYYIPVSTPEISEREIAYVTDCLRSGWISSEGPIVAQFESQFATLVGRKYGIAVANGTIALEILLRGIDIKEGDEVLVPTFTIISCLAAILRVGAIPVYIDADPHTWCMDVTQIERKITPRTRAIMPVHIYGLPVEMTPLLNIANKYDLAILEDASEAHGLLYRETPCGSFGIASSFSFYANKLVTTGEGGMIVTDDPLLAERYRSLRNLCFTTTRRFVHHELGYNARLSALQAAVGVAQLLSLNERIAKKRSVARFYNELLRDEPLLTLHPETTEYSENIYWVYGALLSEACAHSTEHVMNKLHEAGIATRPFFWPLHQQPLLNDTTYKTSEALPVAERLAQRGFYLPCSSQLQQGEISYIATTLKSILYQVTPHR